MKTTTNKHVCRPPNESPRRPKHKQTSPKTAAQANHTTPEQVQHVATTSRARWAVVTNSSCNFSTTLDIKLNATSARTETTAHLDGDLHRHGTRTANVVHDRRRNVHDKMFTTLLPWFSSCTQTAKWLDICEEHPREEDEHEVVEITACATQPQE